MITQDELKTLLTYDENTGIFIWNIGKGTVKKGYIAGCIHSTTGYRVIKINRKIYQAHRLAYLYVYGYMPDLIDHINRKRLNNQIINLRQASYSLNGLNANIPRNNSSGALGVTLNKAAAKWKAQIAINGKTIHLGYFSNLEEAKAARKTAEKNLIPNWIL